MNRDHSNGYACADCVMLLANGETSPELSEDETAAYLARVEHECRGTEDVSLGRMIGEENCECASWEDDAHAYCETDEFSWAACDVCGSHLGGSREAVTFWFPTTTEETT